MPLRELSIRNFAIIKQLEIEINDGLTVVTGETGAGKSIVLNAFNLLLGSRAESGMIRHAEDQCEISALFDISQLDKVHDWLERRDLQIIVEGETSHQCLIRRIIRRNKPTKCYINDQPTTLASLKSLGLLLVDLYDQHEHQSLLRRGTQRQIIDRFAGHDRELFELAKLASQIERKNRQLTALIEGNVDNADRLQLLAFQLNELDEAGLVEGEFDHLIAEQSLLSNAQFLIDGIKLAQDGLFHNDISNISAELGKQASNLARLAEYDSGLATSVELLNSSLALIEESKIGLDSSLSKIEQDPERLHEVDQRLETLVTLARKHRCSEAELVGRYEAIKLEYQGLENQHAEPELLQKELATLTANYAQIAQSISDNRIESAERLSKAITEQMQDLGMQGGKIEIQVNPQNEGNFKFSENGIDHIEFMVSTNQSVPLRSLQATASGGELSRISLAIQVITSEHFSTPTLVFDEVDVGVGGRIADIVGQRLRTLGTHAQVLCITHLAQVASQGDHHLAVEKISNESETYATLVKLENGMRTEEIARMLGGTEITDRTRDHARELLNRPAQDIQVAS